MKNFELIPYPVLHPAGGRQVAGGCALAMMIKAPIAGSSKTRLAPPLTLEEAAQLSRCFLADTAENIAAAVVTGSSEAAGVAVYTPLGMEAAFNGLFPVGFALVAQHEGGFGERLLAAVKDLLTFGFESVCLIDSDSPTMPTASLREAVRVLEQPGDQIVLGPSDDGGYYLIGLKQAHAAVFADIAWSTAEVTAQTVARAGEMNLPVHLLPTWYDVDDAMTLDRLCSEMFDPTPGLGFAARRTREFLTNLMEAEGAARVWPSAPASLA